MFCRYCGSELIDGMKECPKCWTPIDENDTPRYVKNETENQTEPEAEKEEKTDLKEIFLKENAAEEKAKPEIKEEEKTDKKNVIIAVVALIVAAAIIIVTLGIPNKKDSDNSEITNLDTSEITYETITFGSYEQDNDTSNGKEEIEWLVLAKENNRMLVISEYALDCQPFNTEYEDVTWKTCSLRKWLNGTFMNNAFSAEEQVKIQSTTVTADANPEYSTDPGNDTTDKVFLLSITEFEEYFFTDEDRKCVPTAYAIERGAYADSYYSKGGKAICWWWLRSPGLTSDSAALVNYDGSILCSGDGVYYVCNAVRPALWIEI